MKKRGLGMMLTWEQLKWIVTRFLARRKAPIPRPHLATRRQMHLLKFCLAALDSTGLTLFHEMGH